jgi:hypothetical protein
MTIMIEKGSSYTTDYTSTSHPDLTGWTGVAELFTTYPGTAVFAKPLVLATDTSKLTLSLTTSDIFGLAAGAYFLSTTITSPTLESYGLLEYVTLTEVLTFSGPMCKLFLTVAKRDGTPAGVATKMLTNNATGAQLVPGWAGVRISISTALPGVVGGTVLDTETVAVTTNIAGYAEVYVIQGETVTVSGPTLGAAITVNTTGHSSIDLSTLF